MGLTSTEAQKLECFYAQQIVCFIVELKPCKTIKYKKSPACILCHPGSTYVCPTISMVIPFSKNKLARLILENILCMF